MDNYYPASAARQQRSILMGTANRKEHRKEFVRRLNQACDQSKLIPPHGQGRQRMIAERMKVSQETVSKWFKAVAMPPPDTLKALADLSEVDYSWLALGIHTKGYTPPNERRIQARESSGAVHLVWGMWEMNGAQCGLPAANDTHSDYVDFYVTLRGTMTAVHVSVAQPVSKGRYELVLPREYDEVRCIGVVRVGACKYHYLDLTEELIHEHKQMRKGLPTITINIVEKGIYKTGASKWSLVKFGDG